MTEDQILLELKNELCTGAISLSSVCKSFLLFIEEKEKISEDEKIQYLKIFLSDIKLQDLTEEPPDDFFKISIEPSTDLEEIFKLKNRVISNLIQNRATVSDFYKSLWNKLEDPVLYPDLLTKATFLQILWMDPRIPYFELGEGCSMENDAFRSIVEKIRPTIDKGFFILDANLKYKTERASLLMEAADALESSEERTVFWAVLISNLQQRSKALATKLKETFDEDSVAPQ